MASKWADAGGDIRVGIGGWTYAPWRGVFYPEKLPAKRELEYASRRLTAIEINGTFYRSQGPKSFAKWRDETPENFVFAVKGHRAVVNAKKLGEAGGAVEWFFKSGIAELGDEARAGAVAVRAVQEVRRGGSWPRSLRCCRRRSAGARLRHALEVRNKSFLVPEFVDLAREARRRRSSSPIPTSIRRSPT